LHVSNIYLLVVIRGSISCLRKWNIRSFQETSRVYGIQTAPRIPC